MPQVRHADTSEGAGAGCEADLLVPDVSAVGRRETRAPEGARSVVTVVVLTEDRENAVQQVGQRAGAVQQVGDGAQQVAEQIAGA